MQMKFLRNAFVGAVLGLMLGAAPAFAQSTQCISNALAGGTANAITIPQLPCSSGTNLLLLTITATNTSAVTLQQQGGSTIPVDNAAGNPLVAGSLQAGSVVMLSSTGTKWLLLTSSIGGVSPTSVTWSFASVALLEQIGSTAGLDVTSAYVQGVGIYTWNSASTATPDPSDTPQTIVQVTGVTTGRMVLQNGAVGNVANIAALEAFPDAPIGMTVNVGGYTTPGDGGGGTFTVVSGTLSASDGGTTFFVSNSAGGTYTDRYWKRNFIGQLNISWYGAYCSGANASDTSWANAQAASLSLSLPVLVPSGCTVKLTTPPTLASNLDIINDGVITYTGTANNLFDETSLSNISFTGTGEIIFDRTSTQTAYAQSVFLFNTTTSPVIKNQFINATEATDIAFNGVGTAATTGFDIESNKLRATGTSVYTFGVFSVGRTDTGTITTAGNSGVFKDNDVEASVQGMLYDGDDTVVSGNTFHNVNGPGFSTLEVKNLQDIDNQYLNNGGQGLAIGNGTNDLAIGVTITGNTACYNFQGINVYSQQSGDANQGLDRAITITGNVTCGNQHNGIFAYGNGNMDITGNSSYGNTGYGIDSEEGAGGQTPGHITITGNYTYDNAVGGISVTGPSSNTQDSITIGNNIAYDNASTGFYLSGIRGTVTGNQSFLNGAYGFETNSNTASYIGNVAYSNTTYDWYWNTSDTQSVLIGNSFATSNLTAHTSDTLANGIVGEFANTGLFAGDTIINAGGQPATILGAGGTWSGYASAPVYQAGTRYSPTTVAALPACNSSDTGSIFAVDDATSPSYGAALTGGGTDYALALCTGSTWVAH